MISVLFIKKNIPIELNVHEGYQFVIIHLYEHNKMLFSIDGYILHAKNIPTYHITYINPHN